MKKKILSKIGAVAASAVLLTGCLEETIPTSVVTDENLQSSAKASEAVLNGIHGQMKEYLVLGSEWHVDFSYPAQMIIRDVLTGDFAYYQSGYDHFSTWAQNESLGQDYRTTQLVWYTYYKIILAANSALEVLPADLEDNTMLAYRGEALAVRAAMYLDLARMYEFLPNDKTVSVNSSNNDVTGLTVPIVTETTTEAEAQNNPRASHDDMFAFILGDLDEAESLIGGAARPNKQLPDLSVVYGLKARLYMWAENYPKAAEYARMAINAHSGSPLTSDEWLSTTTGFNDLSSSSWMWGLQYASEENPVLSGIVNWTSWMSSETSFGYAGITAGTYPMIDANLYSSIPNTDFRKLSYKAPAGGLLAGSEPVINQEWYEAAAEYASFKFRPGSGNGDDTTVGCAVGLPLMRVEEMYLIEAEATAHTSPNSGKELLETFVKTYRDATYSCAASDVDGVVDACFQQKRIELWGEGLIFFDIKRLNKSVTRAYAGSNWPELQQLNSNGRPAWMNYCIVGLEAQTNIAVEGYNNPDPSGLY